MPPNLHIKYYLKNHHGSLQKWKKHTVTWSANSWRQEEVTTQPSGITFVSATKHTTNSTPRLSVKNGANSVPTPNLPRNRPGWANTNSSPDKHLSQIIYSESRMQEAISSFHPLKAAGTDTLQPLTIQKAWHHIHKTVRNIMIKSHEMQHVPGSWTESNGIFLPKPGKTDYNKPNSYRTITLSPTLLKLQEKVILWHMQHDLGMEDSLSKKQFGFKKGTSTETALHKVILWSYRPISSRLSHRRLDQKHGHQPTCHHNTQKRNQMYQKQTWMPTGRCSFTIPVKPGNRRPSTIHSKTHPGLHSSFCRRHHVSSRRRWPWRNLATHTDHNKNNKNWCQSKGLNISALKTKIVMFTWNRKWSLRPIEVCGETIDLSNEVKLLCITLDSKLTFNTHIDDITKKCIGTLFQCKRAIGPTWGLSPKVCHWIYTAIIRPTLAYCSIVWIRALENKTNTKRLERVQGMALKYMAGAMPSTPYTALNYLTGTPHITDYLKGEAAKGAVRLMGQGDWTLETALFGKGIIKAHSTLSNNFLHTLNKHDSWDITKPKLVLDHSYTITYPTASLTEDYKNRLKQVPMAFAALQTDPKLNMVQVAGLLYPTPVQKPSQSIPSKWKTTVLSSRPKRQPSSMLQKSSSLSTTNK